MKLNQKLLARLGVWLITAISFLLAGIGTSDKLVAIVINFTMLSSLILATIGYDIVFKDEKVKE